MFNDLSVFICKKHIKTHKYTLLVYDGVTCPAISAGVVGSAALRTAGLLQASI